MMTLFERINKPRADKLCAALVVIEKSAKSQRVRPDEVHDLLKPVFTKLLHVTGKYPEAGPAPAPEPVTVPAPTRTLPHPPNAHHAAVAYIETTTTEQALDLLYKLTAHIDFNLRGDTR